MRNRWTVAVLASMTALTACSGGSSSSKTHPTSTPTPDPAHRLAALAAKGAHLSYAGEYRLVAGPKTGQVVVALNPPHYRLVITVGKTQTEFLSTSKGVYTCGRVTHWECFSIARAGQTVPRVVDPGIENVFTRYLSILATQAPAYDISVAPRLVNATCFNVQDTATTPQPTVSEGTYCFDARGVPVKVQFHAGRLTLVKFTRLPGANAFVPPAKPTPLPR